MLPTTQPANRSKPRNYWLAVALTLPLFLLLWVPGAVATALCWILARREQKRYGVAPPGKRALTIELWTLTIAPAVILALAALTRPLHQDYVISGSTMYPTLQQGDHALANSLASPQRGDVIVYRPSIDPGRNYIGRVIGMPGDVISIHDHTVFRDGQPLSEPYESPDRQATYTMAAYHVAPHTLFVLGDNRNYSYDSHEFGVAMPVQTNMVQGVIWCIYSRSHQIRFL